MVRPAIEKMPVAMEDFRYWLRCQHGAAQQYAVDGKGKYLAFSPAWQGFGTEGQLVDAINQSFNPGVPTTTTTTTTSVNPSGEFKKTNVWLIPQGSGIISDAVYTSGVPLSVARVRQSRHRRQRDRQSREAPYFIFSGRQLENAAKSLRGESEKLRNVVKVIARGLEDGGVATFNRDKDGNPIGLVLSQNVVDFLGTSQVVANLDVIPQRPDQPPTN